MFSEPIVMTLVITGLIALFSAASMLLAIRKRRKAPSNTSLLEEKRRARAEVEAEEAAKHWQKRENGLVTRLVTALMRAAEENPPAEIKVIELPGRGGERRILVYTPGLNAYFWGANPKGRVSYCDPVYAISVAVNAEKQEITLSLGGAGSSCTKTFHENATHVLIAHLAGKIREYPPARIRRAN